MNDSRTLPVYVPPEFESDEPLDEVEQALVKMFIGILTRELRAEQAAAAESAMTPTPLTGES